MACVGASIVVLAHGFEAFSQQMVILEQRPLANNNATLSPPRSERWDYFVRRGWSSGKFTVL